MAKRIDPLKAKQAKQKKIAIGLTVMLVGVLALQGPKTLKMLKGPSTPVAEATPAPTTPAPGTPVPAGSVPAPATPATPATPAAVVQPAVLVDTDAPAAADEGQLLSFEQFASKDPFRQQVDLKAAAVAEADPTAPDADSTPGSEPASAGVDPSIPGSAESPPISVGGSGSSGATPGSPAGSSGGSGSSESGTFTSPSSPAAATTISVNGVVQTVTVGSPFPADQPTFELLSLGKGGKSVKIGVAGGTLAGGGPSVELKLGKPLTLQNTADGSRYKLVLLTVEGAAPPTGG